MVDFNRRLCGDRQTTILHHCSVTESCDYLKITGTVLGHKSGQNPYGTLPKKLSDFCPVTVPHLRSTRNSWFPGRRGIYTSTEEFQHEVGEGQDMRFILQALRKFYTEDLASSYFSLDLDWSSRTVHCHDSS